MHAEDRYSSLTHILYIFMDLTNYVHLFIAEICVKITIYGFSDFFLLIIEKKKKNSNQPIK